MPKYLCGCHHAADGMDRKLLDCSVIGAVRILRIDLLLTLGDIMNKPVSLALGLGELAEQRTVNSPHACLRASVSAATLASVSRR